MKKLTHLALLCAIVVIGLLIPPVMAVEVAPGSLAPFIVHPGSQEHPAIDGNMVVWEDGRNGNKDIYFSESAGLNSVPAKGIVVFASQSMTAFTSPAAMS